MASSTGEKMPPEEAMRRLLREMGVEEYEPRVLHQLLEYSHAYCTDIFTDAAHYAEHASRPGQLECEDVQLSSRLNAAAWRVQVLENVKEMWTETPKVRPPPALPASRCTLAHVASCARGRRARARRRPSP